MVGSEGGEFLFAEVVRYFTSFPSLLPRTKLTSLPAQNSPLVDSTPLRSMQTRLFTDLIQDSLVEYAYDAELAGLSYQFNQSGDAISIVVDGYNDKMGVLLEVVTKRMREYKVDEKRFEIVVDQVRFSSSLSFPSVPLDSLEMENGC